MLTEMRRLAVVVACTLASAPAHAQPSSADATDASKRFQAGRDAIKANRIDEACALFAQSYQLDPALGTALNLADCVERQGHLARAWRLFDLVARESSNAPSRAKLARGRADALKPRLATLLIHIHEPGVPGLALAIAGDRVAPGAELRELVDPGAVDLVATAPGRAPFRTTVYVLANDMSVAEIPALAPSSSSDAPAPAPAPALTPVPVAPASPSETHIRRSRLWLAGGVGAGGAIGLGVSLGLAISARHIYDSAFDADCRDTARGVACNDRGNATIARAGDRADLATGFVIGGAVLVAAGAALYFTAPRDAVQVAPVATRDAWGLGIAGQF